MLSDDEFAQMEAELLDAEEETRRSEQFLLLAAEFMRVMDQPYQPGDQERGKYLATLLAEMRKINRP